MCMVYVCSCLTFCVFFFKQKTAYEMRISDWSSDVCSSDLLRIDNVETLPAERITANDEERQRQGFDIQTVFAWPLRDGALDVASALAGDGDGQIGRASCRERVCPYV